MVLTVRDGGVDQFLKYRALLGYVVGREADDVPTRLGVPAEYVNTGVFQPSIEFLGSVETEGHKDVLLTKSERDHVVRRAVSGKADVTCCTSVRKRRIRTLDQVKNGRHVGRRSSVSRVSSPIVTVCRSGDLLFLVDEAERESIRGPW